MKILVNDLAASSGGALTILKDFYNYISKNELDHEWIFLLSNRYLEEKKNIKIITLPFVKNNWIERLKFDFIFSKKLLDEINPDIIISLQNTAFMHTNIPQITYVHQSIPFQRIKKFSFFKQEERILAVYQYIIGAVIKKSIRVSDKVIVQTKWMKDEIVKQLRVSNDKVEIIMPKIPIINMENINREVNMKRFFYPAEDSIYKNHRCIIDAIKKLEDEKIYDYEVDLTLSNENKNKYINKSIKLIGKLSHEEVISILSESILIFPSYIETIGLPLVEAMQVNAIIFVADCEYSREILKSYKNAYYFNPFDSNELAELMKLAINNKIVRVENNFSINKNYTSWEKLDQILKCIEER